MSDILGRVFTILLCAWLMFLFPLMEVQRQCIQTETMYLYQETVYFVDGVRNTGEIRHTDRKNYKPDEPFVYRKNVLWYDRTC